MEPPPRAEPIPATLDALQAAWPEIVADVRERSRFLGEALSHTTPAALELPWLTVALAEPNPLFAERLQAQARLVEEVLGRAIGQPARLRVTEAGPPDGAPMSGDPARLQTAFQAIFRAILREQAGPATVVAERRRETVDGEPGAVVIVAVEGSVQEAYDGASGPFDDRRGGLGLALPLARRVIEGRRGRMRSPASASTASANADSLVRCSVVISFPLGS